MDNFIELSLSFVLARRSNRRCFSGLPVDMTTSIGDGTLHLTFMRCFSNLLQINLHITNHGSRTMSIVRFDVDLAVVCRSLSIYICIFVSICWPISVYAYLYLSVPICTEICQSVSVCANLYRSMQISPIMSPISMKFLDLCLTAQEYLYLD